MDVLKSSHSSQSRPRSGDEIRAAFLSFFAERGHKVIPSASLVPEDPTVLLTIAGMLPFKPVFLDQADRPAARATSSQKCIRTNDIENVGRTARHQTFFEMLGNFSFGDYFKQDAIKWAWELTTEVFGLDPNNLVVSVFNEDDESEKIWRDLIGVNPKRIIRMGSKDNFWSSGPTGPCGPCSELYFDFKPELGEDNINLEDDSRFIEFYNLVFMQYNRDAEGNLTSLANCNIDTGMGLERMAQIIQKVPNNYETDLIYPLILKAAELARIDYSTIGERRKTSLKVIADHIRAVIQLICDGVVAGNLGRGYVLRRLLRRLIRHGRLIGIENPFLEILGEEAIFLMGKAYPQLNERKDLILSELRVEELRFSQTLERGNRLLEDLIESNPKDISGEQAFELYDTYGFPIELTQEIAAEKNLDVDIEVFDQLMKKQKQRAKLAATTVDLTIQNSIEQIASSLESTNFQGYQYLECSCKVCAIFIRGESVKSASAGDNVQIILDRTPFYGESGGQLGDRGILLGDGLIVDIDSVTKEREIYVHCGHIRSGELSINQTINAQVDKVARRRVAANHTATHLLQAALKVVLDSNVGQRGSLVTFDRLRFDFNYSQALTLDQIQQLERLINDWIVEANKLNINTMPMDEAIDLGALAMFGEKYDDVVRVVDVPGVSMELCGGTHVENTYEIGMFKIISEIGIAAGIRRIEAIAGLSILEYINERDLVVKELGERLKVQPSEIVERVFSFQDELKSLTKLIAKQREELAIAKANVLARKAFECNSYSILIERLDAIEGAALQSAAQSLLNELGDQSAVILGGLPDPEDQKKVVLVAAFGSKVVSKGIKAGQFIGTIAKLCGGGGGGRANLAQAGGRDGTQLNSALDTARNELSSLLI